MGVIGFSGTVPMIVEMDRQEPIDGVWLKSGLGYNNLIRVGDAQEIRKYKGLEGAQLYCAKHRINMSKLTPGELKFLQNKKGEEWAQSFCTDKSPNRQPALHHKSFKENIMAQGTISQQLDILMAAPKSLPVMRPRSVRTTKSETQK